jgi:ATP synthase protein I
MVDGDRERQHVSEPDLGRRVGHKAARKLRGRRQKRRTVWFGLGMFGLVGWAVAVPTLIGIGIGVWLDDRYPAGQVSWTLTFLVLGIAVGCLNAWYWIKQESSDE